MTDAERKPWGASGWYWLWRGEDGRTAGPVGPYESREAIGRQTIPHGARFVAVYIDADGEIERLRKGENAARGQVKKLERAYDCLRRENAKLRDLVLLLEENAKLRELERLRNENAKLRELVRDAYGDGLNTAWHDRARELLEGGDK